MSKKSAKIPQPDIETRIRSMLDRVASHSGVAGVYYDMHSATSTLAGRGVCRLCRGCLRHPQAASFCRSNACTAALQGHSAGDVWYFRCWLGIDGFALPVAPDDAIVGAVEFAGWFGPGDKQNSLDRVLARLANLDSQAPTESYISALQAMPEHPFAQVRAIAEFALQASFSEGLNRADAFDFRHRAAQQQQRLFARLENRNSRAAAPTDLQTTLAALSQALESGDSNTRLVALDEVLCAILLEAGGNFDQVRAALSALPAALLRERVRQGEGWKPAATRFDEEMMELDGSGSVEEAFLRAEEWILHRQLKLPAGHAADRESLPSLSRRILTWMHEKYPQNINARRASREVGASLSSITHRLKQETGKGFSEHLRTVRVNEAKRLLAYTDLTLSEIAGKCGFSDPSYFTKVFRAEINLSPSEFRKMLSVDTTEGTSRH